MIALRITRPARTRCRSMAHPLKHAESSARKFGGKADDYFPIHNWFDESKAFLADFRHRALRHHAEGIFLAEKLFGVAIVNSDGNQVPVRYVGELHVREDLGRIPTAADWISQIKPQRWMYGQKIVDQIPEDQRELRNEVWLIADGLPNGWSRMASRSLRTECRWSRMASGMAANGGSRDEYLERSRREFYLQLTAYGNGSSRCI